jgi:hypothetical protein
MGSGLCGKVETILALIRKSKEKMASHRAGRESFVLELKMVWES